MKESFCIKPLSVYKKLFPNITSGYYPIQFSPSMNPYAYVFYSTDDTLDNKVVELRLIDSKWDLLRVREDRKSEIGQYNDFRIAELTYINYFDLFPLSDLWKPNTSYFNKQTFDIWTAGNNYKRYIIGTVIAKYLTNAKWVIDEAAGRGADLFRYMNVGVANLLCLDNDVSAISELLRRKFEPRQQQQSKCTNVMTAVVDLTSKKEIIKQSIITFSPPLVDAIVCNFALHYMCGNASHIKNLLEVNYEILAKGGLFIFSVMDGQKVFNELMNGDYEIFQDDVLKYCIKKKYTTDKLGLYGQKIEVLLPFSTNMYEESLVNIDNIIKLSSNIGFELVERRSFVDFPQNKYLYDRLSEDDIHYIGLHSMVVLKKL
jgi:SAM-dependent methyltransferase